MPIYRLDNAVQPYAWGSHTAIAQLLGQPSPSAEPQAELWMGAHPLAPSQVLLESGGEPLDRWIAASPNELLGERVSREFQGELPFLLKVLAADRPLSLQAHPSREQARAGFAEEERRGIARTALERCYRDENHKPELICALTPFEALCGFRQLQHSEALLKRLAVSELAPLQAELQRGELAAGFRWLMTLPAKSREALVGQVCRACAGLARAADWMGPVCAWAARLGTLHPSDAGVIGAPCCSTWCCSSLARRCTCPPVTSTPTCAGLAWRSWRVRTMCCAVASPRNT